MRTLSIAGNQLDAYHVCAFFDSRQQEYAVLAPFYQEAVEQRERNLHIVAPELRDDHMARLRDAGMDTHRCTACGQLEVLSWQQAYLNEEGAFDKHKMLAAIESLTRDAAAGEFTGLRIMGNMAWVFSGLPGAENIIEYEAEVNEVLARNRQPAICVYDTAQLTGSMMMDLLRTHPLTLINGVIQENPYFTPPRDMLDELRRRGAASTAAAS
jgi:MEDS: MEthanogen/methylotroph, DcmR Sensory domain